MPRLWPIPFAAPVVLLVGCSATQIESAYFGPSTAIERAIKLHYERHAAEGSCFSPYIDGFTRLDVLEDTPEQLVIQARYFYRDRVQDGREGDGGGGQVCTGFSERTFTLTRGPDGRPVAVEMTGEQDEHAIRSLIRRVLPK